MGYLCSATWSVCSAAKSDRISTQRPTTRTERGGGPFCSRHLCRLGTLSTPFSPFQYTITRCCLLRGQAPRWPCEVSFSPRFPDDACVSRKHAPACTSLHYYQSIGGNLGLTARSIDSEASHFPRPLPRRRRPLNLLPQRCRERRPAARRVRPREARPQGSPAPQPGGHQGARSIRAVRTLLPPPLCWLADCRTLRPSNPQLYSSPANIHRLFLAQPSTS
jgi:hypothetical protein